MIFNEQLLFVIQFIRIFNLIEKEVLRLVEYDDGVITAPQWVPIWIFYSVFASIFFQVSNFSISGYSSNNFPLFPLLGSHFYRSKSLLREVD